MEFTQIVGQPGRFVVHQGGVFKGEGWLLNFRIWKHHEKEGVIQCTVDLGDYETYVWVATAALSSPEILDTPGTAPFLVYAELTMTDNGLMPLMKIIAFVLNDEWIKC